MDQEYFVDYSSGRMNFNKFGHQNPLSNHMGNHHFPRLYNKKLKDYLDEAETDCETELILIKINLSKFPERIKDFIWIETLELQNNNLKYIDESFSFFPNLKKLNITKNDINRIDGQNLPDSLEELNLSGNNICTIIDLKEGLITIDLSNNNLQNNILEIPKTVTDLDISHNNTLFILPKFKSDENLSKLDISNTMIRSIDNIPQSVNILKACDCNINRISKFPSSLMEFTAFNSHIYIIDTEFPKDLFELDLYKNNLKEIPPLPENVNNIDLGNNNLEKIPILPDSLSKIDLTGNLKLSLEELDELKNKHKTIDIKYTQKNNDNWNIDGDCDGFMGIFSNDDYRTAISQHHHHFANHNNHNSHNLNHHINNHHHHHSHHHHHYRFTNERQFENHNYHHNYMHKPSPSFYGKFNKSNPYYIIHKSIYNA